MRRNIERMMISVSAKCTSIVISDPEKSCVMFSKHMYEYGLRCIVELV